MHERSVDIQRTISSPSNNLLRLTSYANAVVSFVLIPQAATTTHTPQGADKSVTSVRNDNVLTILLSTRIILCAYYRPRRWIINSSETSSRGVQRSLYVVYCSVKSITENAYWFVWWVWRRNRKILKKQKKISTNWAISIVVYSTRFCNEFSLCMKAVIIHMVSSDTLGKPFSKFLEHSCSSHRMRNVT